MDATSTATTLGASGALTAIRLLAWKGAEFLNHRRFVSRCCGRMFDWQFDMSTPTATSGLQPEPAPPPLPPAPPPSPVPAQIAVGPPPPLPPIRAPTPTLSASGRHIGAGIAAVSGDTTGPGRHHRRVAPLSTGGPA